MDLQDFNKSIIEEFRTNAGVVGGQFANVPMLLLTTTGAKSGKTRINPLAYVADDDRCIIVASYAGAPKNPPWYYNLVANPEVTVEVGGDTFTALATVLGEPERSEMYNKVSDALPMFAEYQSKTTRVIPVIALTRK